VAALPGSANIGWVRVSAKPLKQALATWASKWVYVFTKYLQGKVRVGWVGGWVVVVGRPACCCLGSGAAVRSRHYNLLLNPECQHKRNPTGDGVCV